MIYRTLIETGQLAELLSDSRVAIVDCRFDLKDTAAGEHAYAAGHIPGAVYAHLDRDLSGPKTGANGRHPLPDPSSFAGTLGAFGIGRDTQVVVYGLDSGGFASRLWWMIRWLGHDAVAVLDGGLTKWMAEGRPLSPGIERRAATVFHAQVRPQMLVTTADVAADGQDRWLLIDARASERFRGDTEPIDQAAGHIPGAVNHPFLTNLDTNGTFRSPAALAAAFRAELQGVPPAAVVCYCGSGVTACQNLLALEHAGVSGAKLYPGSWSEWSSDPHRPIATGDALTDA